jgi:hypothetical protein
MRFLAPFQISVIAASCVLERHRADDDFAASGEVSAATGERNERIGSG